MSPGLAKSPTTSMLVFYSSNIPQCIQAKPVTTAAVVVALTKVRPPCSWSLWAQKMDGKSCTVGLAAFFTWICPQEVWFRRWERCAVSVGKECSVFFPTLPKLAGKQLHGFPCPKGRNRSAMVERRKKGRSEWSPILHTVCCDRLAMDYNMTYSHGGTPSPLLPQYQWCSFSPDLPRSFKHCKETQEYLHDGRSVLCICPILNRKLHHGAMSNSHWDPWIQTFHLHPKKR